MGKASEGGEVFAGLVERTLNLTVSPRRSLGRLKEKSKSKVVFLSVALASSRGEPKYPSASDSSRMNSILESTTGGLQVKLTKYSLKPPEAQAAVQAEFPARFGLSAAVGLFSTWACRLLPPNSKRARAGTSMLYVEQKFLISVGFKRLWA